MGSIDWGNIYGGGNKSTSTFVGPVRRTQADIDEEERKKKAQAPKSSIDWGSIYKGADDAQAKRQATQQRQSVVNSIPQVKQGILPNLAAGFMDVFKPAGQAVKQQVQQFNNFRDSNDKASLELTNIFQRAGKKPEFTSTEQVFEQSPAGQFLNKESTKKVISRIAAETRDIPLRTANRIESAITGKSYAETTAETDRAKAEAGGIKKFLYNIQSTGPQTAIGALLAVGATYLTKGKDKGKVGSLLSSTFFGALSADEQLKQDGKITSPGKIAVDIVGDRVLTASLTKVFQTPVKSLTREIIKDFGIEGGTEVSQSLAKFGIDYSSAKTDEERAAVMERAKQYVREEMIMEFAVGGVIGGGLGATAGLTGNSTNITVTEDDNKKPPSIAEQLGITETPEVSRSRGGIREELGIGEVGGAPAQPPQLSIREQLRQAEIPEISQDDIATYGVTGTARAGQRFFGEPSEIGASMIERMGAKYDEIGILAQASRKIETRRDARKLIRLMSTRVEDSFRIQKLYELQDQLESEPGSAEYNILNEAINLVLPKASKDMTAEEEEAQAYEFSKRLAAERKSKGQAIILDPDEIKTATNNPDTQNHPAYSKAQIKVYQDLLKEVENPVVKFTAGGPASGKTDFVVDVIKDGHNGIILDGTLASYQHFTERAKEAALVGKKVEVHAVLPSLTNSWEFQKARKAKTGRGIDLGGYLDRHIGVVDTLIKILKNNPEVEVHLKDTRLITDSAQAKAAPFITDKALILDILENIKYNKDNLTKQLNAKQRSTTRTNRRAEQADSRQETVLNSRGDRGGKQSSERGGSASRESGKDAQLAEGSRSDQGLETKVGELKSRVYARLQEENGDVLTDDVTYTEAKLEKEAEKASKLVLQDKDKAFRIAMGMEESPDVLSTAVSIALSEQALEDGNIELYNRLITNRSLRLTRMGQEIVAEKGSVTSNNLSYFVKQLLKMRLEEVGSNWTADIKQIKGLAGKKVKSATTRAVEMIDEGVKEAKKKIGNSKSMDIAEAQKLIDSLKC